MTPSAEVVIKCLKFVLKHKAVVISPQVVLQMTFPLIASYIVTNLSVQDEITTPAFESNETLI